VAPVEISVVVPVYKCAGCLRHLHERLTLVLTDMGVSHELVFVDDRSPDEAWDALQELVLRDPAVRAVRLSRNFGQHAAITAGVAEAVGQWVVVMDCDLQDPPEAIPDLYAKAQKGNDIVFARRRARRQPWARRIANRIYFWLRRTLTGVDLETEHSNLSIMSRKAADAFLLLRDKHRNFLLILYWLGFQHDSIEFEHADRYEGKSSYSLRGLIQVAADGLFFHTTALLAWIVYFGFLVSLSAVGLAAFFVYERLSSRAFPGWTSIAVLVLLIGGFIIMSTGVGALYIGKVFEQVKARPLYLVDERIGVSQAGRLDVPEGQEAAELSPAGSG
jgi:glycosyltransferase involved in cell wall biosynthesis